MNQTYEKQVELLLDVLPFIAKEKCFALKGGTAINLFVRDMPRLSVDIDLTYLPIESRDMTIKNLVNALERIAADIQNTLPNIYIHKHLTAKEHRLNKLFIKNQDVQIIVEPNEVLRGSVFPVMQSDLCLSAIKKFGREVIDVTSLSIADLYGGKICAALDRQHARDLFDMQLLFENEGINEEIRQAFVIYLASSPRPMHELLQPNLLDITASFEKEFSGMTNNAIGISDLLNTRKMLIENINKNLTLNERMFLLSIKECEPKWSLLNLPEIEYLPALKWKMLNIQKMENNKRQLLVNKLKMVLDM